MVSTTWRDVASATSGSTGLRSYRATTFDPVVAVWYTKNQPFVA
jgi:hypothetical protein